MTITLHNASASALAFFVRAEVTAGQGGTEVVPVTYSDNDVTLFPGESTTLYATYAPADLGGQQAALRVHGYNVPSFGGAVVGVGESRPAGAAVSLRSAPNPFTARTAIRFDLARRGPASLCVYDPAGRLVRRLVPRRVVDAGAHEALWDGRDDAGAKLPSGLYFCRLGAGEERRTIRIALVR
jgi:hypothetical protein